MAKYKSSGINFKHYLLILGSMLTVLALVVFIAASQKPTNTQSDASEIAAGCRDNPTFTSSGTNARTNSITYIYKVGHPKNGCKSILYGARMIPPHWTWNIEYKKNNGPWVSNWTKMIVTGKIKAGVTDIVRMRISPPDGAENKKYNLTAEACRADMTESGGINLGYPCITRTATYIKD